MQIVNADSSRAVIPVQAWIQPLYPLDQKRMIPFRGDERPQGGMRFLGYRMPEVRSYGPGGRAVHGARQGAMVDLYV